MRNQNLKFILKCRECGHLTSIVRSLSRTQTVLEGTKWHKCVNNARDFYVIIDRLESAQLYDKHDNEIFEGDNCKMFDNSVCEVIFQDGAFGYIPSEHIGFIPFAGNSNLNWDNERSEHIEIIGNKYDISITNKKRQTLLESIEL
jgi:hypothetical protein